MSNLIYVLCGFLWATGATFWFLAGNRAMTIMYVALAVMYFTLAAAGV